MPNVNPEPRVVVASKSLYSPNQSYQNLRTWICVGERDTFFHEKYNDEPSCSIFVCMERSHIWNSPTSICQLVDLYLKENDLAACNLEDEDGEIAGVVIFKESGATMENLAEVFATDNLRTENITGLVEKLKTNG